MCMYAIIFVMMFLLYLFCDYLRYICCQMNLENVERMIISSNMDFHMCRRVNKSIKLYSGELLTFHDVTR